MCVFLCLLVVCFGFAFLLSACYSEVPGSAFGFVLFCFVRFLSSLFFSSTTSLVTCFFRCSSSSYFLIDARFVCVCVCDGDLGGREGGK